MNVANSTILITGGTSGIGLALVKQLSGQGANVIVTGRSQDALTRTKDQFNFQVCRQNGKGGR